MENSQVLQVDRKHLAILITPTEASAILGVHVNTLERWVKQGRLKCIRTPGGHRRFRLDEVLEFAMKREVKR